MECILIKCTLVPFTPVPPLSPKHFSLPTSCGLFLNLLNTLVTARVSRVVGPPTNSEFICAKPNHVQQIGTEGNVEECIHFLH